MSVYVSNWAWSNASELDLAPSELLVLLCLADHAHDDGTEARPGVATIAQKTRLSRKTVQRCLRSLQARGVIRPESSTRGGRGRRGAGNVTSYRFPLYSKGVTTTPLEGRNGQASASKSVTTTPLKGDARASSGASKGVMQGAQGCHLGSPYRRTIQNHPEPPPPARANEQDGAPTAPNTAVGGGGRLSDSQERDARAVLASRPLALNLTDQADAAATPGVLRALGDLVAETGEAPERVARVLAKAHRQPLRDANSSLGGALLSRVPKARGMFAELKSKSGQDGARTPEQVEAPRAPSAPDGTAGDKPERSRPAQRSGVLSAALRQRPIPPALAGAPRPAPRPAGEEVREQPG